MSRLVPENLLAIFRHDRPHGRLRDGSVDQQLVQKCQRDGAKDQEVEINPGREGQKALGDGQNDAPNQEGVGRLGRQSEHFHFRDLFQQGRRHHLAPHRGQGSVLPSRGAKQSQMARIGQRAVQLGHFVPRW